MLAFAIAGGLIGWLASRRRAWSVFLIVFSVMGSISVAAARRGEVDALVSIAAFWVAAQGAWFLAQLLADRRVGIETSPRPEA